MTGLSQEYPPFTSAEVCRIARVSPRQLQWWNERHVVSSRYQGRKRVYPPEDMLKILVVSELRRKGVSLQKIRRVVRLFQREMDRRPQEFLRGQSDLHLITDGRAVYFEDNPERVIERLKNAREPLFLVCISDQVSRADEASEKVRERKNKKRARCDEDQLPLF